MTAETLAWADGRKDWQPLRSIPEIGDTLAAATAPAAGGAATEAAQPAAGAAAELAAESFQHAKPGPKGAEPAAGNQPGRRKAAVVAKAAKAAPAHAAPEDSELAAFQAEMSALGAVPATLGKSPGSLMLPFHLWLLASGQQDTGLSCPCETESMHGPQGQYESGAQAPIWMMSI